MATKPDNNSDFRAKTESDIKLEKSEKTDKQNDAKSAKNGTLKSIIIILVIGFVYYLIVKFTPFGIPCYIKTFTGYDCPTCGMTRMIMALTRLDFKSAFGYNRFMFISFPFIVAEIIYLIYINESKKNVGKLNKILLWGWTVLLVLYGILRNIYPI